MPDQEFDFPLMGGADTGTDAVSSVKPRKMINCWYQKTEGIVRRFGTQRLTTQTAVFNTKDVYDPTLDPSSAYYAAWSNESPVSLVVDRDDIRLRTSIYAREYSNSRWYTTDMLPSVRVDQITVGVTSDPGITTSTVSPGVGSTDMAANDSFAIIAYQLSVSELYYTIVDVNDFSVVVDRRTVPLPFSPPVTPSCVQCARVGNDFIISYGQDSDNKIYIYKVDGITFKIDSSPSVTLTDKRVNSKHFSVVNDKLTPGTGFWVVYHSTTGGNGYKARFYNNLFSNTGTVNLTSTSSASEDCFVDVYATNIYCLFSDPATPSWRVIAYDNTGSPISVGDNFSGEVLQTGAIAVYPGEVVVSSQTTTSGVYDDVNIRIYDSSITAATVQRRQVYGSQLCSGPVRLVDQSNNSIYFQNLLTQSADVASQATEGVCSFWIPKRAQTSDPRILAFYGMGTDGFQSTGSQPKSVLPSSSVAFSLGLQNGSITLYRTRLLSSGMSTRTGYLQNHNIIGDDFNLINFPGSPSVSAAVDSVSGSGLEANTSYSFTCTLTYTDDAGRFVESIPAIPASASLGSGDDGVKLTITLPLMAVNPTDLRVRIYRTLGNQTAYLLTDVVSVTSTQQNLTWSTSSTQTDSDIASNPQLYTEGGALDHVCPPVFTCSTKHQNRLFLGGTPDDTIWFSNERIAGETYHFNEGLTFQPFEGGRVVALQSLDTALVVFKSEDIYAIQGQGPNDQGLDSGYSLPQNIQSNTGCTEADSVVSTPLGIFFRGRRGLYLLDRSLQVKYVGKPIENDLTSSITDAVYVESQNQVRFFTSQGVFVYDLLNDAWSLFTYPVTFVKAVVSGGILYMVNTLSNLYKETTGYLDDGAPYSMKFQTAYFRPQAGLKQAWQRFRRISLRGHKYSDRGVIITLMRDGIDSQSETRSWGPTDITYRPADPQLQVHPTVQKMQSLSVQFEDFDAGTTGTGQGWTLQAISCKVAAARGEAKIPSGNNK